MLYMYGYGGYNNYMFVSTMPLTAERREKGPRGFVVDKITLIEREIELFWR